MAPPAGGHACVQKIPKDKELVGFEVLTEVTMNSMMFCAVTTRSLVVVTDVSEKRTATIFRVEQ
jgi:hypothetical protein